MKKNLCTMLTVAGTGMLLSGCGYFTQFDNFENSAKLRVGMTKEQVKTIMGEPVDEVFCKPDLWYYYVNTQWHDGLITRDECMPVVFKDGKVAGWGNDYYNRSVVVERRYSLPEIEGVNTSAAAPPALKAPEEAEPQEAGKEKQKPAAPAVDIDKDAAEHPDIAPAV